MKRLNFKISNRSIRRATSRVKNISASVDRLNSDYLRGKYIELGALVKATTKVATGQTRKAAYTQSTRTGNGELFISGYRPTDNNQSFECEFGDFKVHVTLRGHHDSRDKPKCSRTPSDLFTRIGSYQVNTNARNRALGLAIRHTFQEEPGPALGKGTINVFYEVSMRNVIRTLKLLSVAVTGHK